MGESGAAADNLWQLSFPPFYTLQPHADTRRKQLDTWTRIVLDHCRANRLTSVNTDELASAASGPFVNEEIKRRASGDLLNAIWEDLEAKAGFIFVYCIV